MIEGGNDCSAAVAAMKRWIDAMSTHDLKFVASILSDDFQFTCNPEILPGGRLDRSGYLSMNAQMEGSDVQLVDLVARRVSGIVAMLLFVEIRERIGDRTSVDADTLRACEVVNGKTLAYASAWRERDGRWLCFSHNALGLVE